MRKFTIFLAFMLLSSLQVVLAQTKITGKVTSAEDGSPLIGLSVVVKGTTVGTTTDLNGNYELTVPEDAEVLVFSYVGMTTKEIDIGGRTVINVQLEPAAYAMDEVVVTALGISREKKALGYSVQDVSGEEINQARETNIVNSLSGRVAGVQVTSASGAVGASSRIIIRGNNSFGNNQPLFVVDGIPILNTSQAVSQWGGTDFGNAAMDIDPSNVESISVLKGANAAALYGERANNGVIVITTKKGEKPGVAKKGIGVDYSMSMTWDNVYVIPNYQNKYGQGFNGSEYVAKQNGVDVTNLQDYNDYAVNNSFSYYNGNWGGTLDGIDESWGPRLDIGLQIPQFDSPWLDASGNITTDPDQFASYQPTPWVSRPDNVQNFFETGTTLTNFVGLKATGEKAAARLSYTNVDQKGAIPNTDLTKNTVNFSGTMNLSKRLSAEAVVMYTNNHSNNLPGAGYDPSNVMQSIGSWFGRQVNMESLEENWETWDPFGNPYNWNRSYHNNPYWTVHKNVTMRDRDRMFGTIKVNYDLTDWLSVMGRVGNDWYYEKRKFTMAAKGIEVGPGGQFWMQERTERELNADLIFNIDKQITEDLSLNAFIGANYRNHKYNFSEIEAFSLTVPNLFTIGNVKGNTAADMYKEEYETNSIFGSASLSFKDYLYLDVTGRNDWSSTLPKDNWSYFYPSVSLSWIFSEAFNINENVLSFGKIRGGYAQVGGATSPYQTVATYASSTSAFNGVAQYYFSRELPPLDLKPEQSKSIEFGTNLMFFKNRLSLDFTYYDTKTENQIMAVDISPASGFNSMRINAGEIENSGVEIVLGAGIVDSKEGFNWDITLNWAKNNNMVNELYGDLEAYTIASSWGGLTIEARPGEAFGVIKGGGYTLDDQGRVIVNPNTGMPMHTPVPVEIGNVMPDWNGGVRNTFSYKNLELSILFDGRMGGDIFSVTDWFGGYAGISEETAAGDIRENGMIVGKDVLDDKGAVLAATDAGGNIIYDNDGFATGSGVENDIVVAPQSYFSDYWGLQEASIIDGSFIKLREVVLTYRIPQSALDKIGFIKQLSLSFVGRNLALLYIDESNDIGIDPETGFGTTLSGMGLEQYQLPPTRSLGFKFNVSF